MKKPSPLTTPNAGSANDTVERVSAQAARVSAPASLERTLRALSPRVDLEELRTFVAVAELGSFTAAADFLSRTTAAVSYRVKRLEMSLGVELFNRAHSQQGSTGRTTLTPVGEWLFEKSQSLLTWQDELPEEIRAIKDGVEPRFTLVINNLLYDNQAVAKLLNRLHQTFPHTQLKVVRAVYMGVWDALIYAKCQLAIGAPTFHAVDNHYVVEPLGVVSWHLVVAQHHPLAKKRRVTENDLRRFPVVNIEDSSLNLQKRAPWRLAGQDEILVPDIRTKLACHVDGLGVGFLPLAMVEPYLRRGELVELTLTDTPRSDSPMSIAWARKDQNGRINQWLRGLIAKRDPLIVPLLAALSEVSDVSPDDAP